MNKVFLFLSYGDDFYMEKRENELFFLYIETNLKINDENLNKEVNNFLIKRFGANFEDYLSISKIDDAHGIAFIEVEDGHDATTDDCVDGDAFLEKMKTLNFMLLSKDYGLGGIENKMIDNGKDKIALTEDNYLVFKWLYDNFFYQLEDGYIPPFQFQYLTPTFANAYKKNNA